MEQVSFTIRMDKDIKEKFDEICSSLGLIDDSAIHVFARQMIQEKGFPFIPTIKPKKENEEFLSRIEKERIQAMENGNADMSLEGIHKEIAEARKERKPKKNSNKA